MSSNAPALRGVRLTAPLSPALHLGASRILTISTKYPRTRVEADTPSTVGYPPPAQVPSVLYNAVFLDLIDEDILRSRKVTTCSSKCGPRSARRCASSTSSCFDHCVILASSPESSSRAFRACSVISRADSAPSVAASPDILSLILFQVDYLKRLIEIGEADAAAQGDAIEAFLARPVLDRV